MQLKRVFFLFVFIIAVLAFPTGLRWFTYGFKVAKLQLYLPHTPEWEINPAIARDDLHRILSQRFRFLGKGAQCYAFVSQDDQYVLKLFRFDRRKKRKAKTASFKKWDSFFSACKLGYEKAREETALVYLHLNLTSGELPVLEALSPNGRLLRLPLDGYRFAIQKKARLLKEVLFAARADGTLEKKMDALLALLSSRSEKGIGNGDPNLWRNFGFVDDLAVEIDFGNYRLRPDFVEEEARRAELNRYIAPLRRWVIEYAPEYTAYLDARSSSGAFK